MKTNILVLIIIVLLSSLTAMFSVLPETVTEFTQAFVVSCIFWFLVLLPLFNYRPFEKYEVSDEMMKWIEENNP